MKNLLVFAACITLPIEFGRAVEWDVEDTSPALTERSAVIYQRKSIRKKGDTSFFGSRVIQVVLFDSKEATFKVIDNGGGAQQQYPNLAVAMMKNQCLAGCNGGFFLKNYATSGLMISEGESSGKWGTAKLLSGAVLVGKDSLPQLIRRSEYRPNSATELLQAGPFLIDQGKQVKGLSKTNARRRSFILHDGGRKFALGISDSFTLDELASVLSVAKVFGDTKVHRALNLDGGTSTGFFYDRGKDFANIHVEPFKRVRNFIGIVPFPK